MLVELAYAESADDSPDALARLIEALERVHDRRQRADAYNELARLLFFKGDIVESVAAAERGLAEARSRMTTSRASWCPRTSPRRRCSRSRCDRHPDRLGTLLPDARAGRPPQDPLLCAHLCARMAVAGDPAHAGAPVVERALGRHPLVDENAHGVVLARPIIALLCIDELDRAVPRSSRRHDRARPDVAHHPDRGPPLVGRGLVPPRRPRCRRRPRRAGSRRLPHRRLGPLRAVDRRQPGPGPSRVGRHRRRARCPRQQPTPGGRPDQPRPGARGPRSPRARDGPARRGTRPLHRVPAAPSTARPGQPGVHGLALLRRTRRPRLGRREQAAELVGRRAHPRPPHRHPSLGGSRAARRRPRLAEERARHRAVGRVRPDTRALSRDGSSGPGRWPSSAPRSVATASEPAARPLSARRSTSPRRPAPARWCSGSARSCSPPAAVPGRARQSGVDALTPTERRIADAGVHRSRRTRRSPTRSTSRTRPSNGTWPTSTASSRSPAGASSPRPSPIADRTPWPGHAEHRPVRPPKRRSSRPATLSRTPFHPASHAVES